MNQKISAILENIETDIKKRKVEIEKFRKKQEETARAFYKEYRKNINLIEKYQSDNDIKWEISAPLIIEEIAQKYSNEFNNKNATDLNEFIKEKIDPQKAISNYHKNYLYVFFHNAASDIHNISFIKKEQKDQILKEEQDLLSEKNKLEEIKKLKELIKFKPSYENFQAMKESLSDSLPEKTWTYIKEQLEASDGFRADKNSLLSNKNLEAKK